MAQDDKYLLSKFRDKTLTLGDALTVDALTVKTVDKRTGIVEKPNTKRDSLKNSLIKAGYPMDTPYSVVNDSEFLKKLDSLGTNAPFRNLKTAEIALANLGVINPTPDGRSSFDYPNTFVGSSGKANAMQKTGQLENNKQPRRTRAFKEIPKGKVAFPNIISAINTIPDPDVKGLIFLNAMIPNRPGEIANLRLDEIDFNRGFIGGDADLQKGDPLFRLTKNRNSVDVPEWLREWLKTERDRTLARNPNAEFLFNPPDGSDAKLVDLARAEIQKPGGLRDLFLADKKLLGREVKGLKDLQKIVPSILATELKQKDAAKALLGHTTFEGFANSMADVSDRHYLSPVETIDESKSRAALKVLHSGYAEVLGLDSLNQLPAKAGYSVPSLVEEGAIKYPIISKGKTDAGLLKQNTVVTPIDKELADLNLKESKAQSRANIAKFGRQEQVDWKEILDLEKENIQADLELEPERIEAENVKKELRQKNRAEKIEEKKNYRLIYVQEDDYIAKHKDIYEGQEWVYKRNPNGRISMFKEQLITATRERRTYLVSFKNKKTGEICDFQQIDRNDIDFSLKGFKSKEEFLKEWSWVDGSFRRSGTIVDVVERLKYTSVVKSKKSNRLVKKGYGGVILGKREKYYDLSF